MTYVWCTCVHGNRKAKWKLKTERQKESRIQNTNKSNDKMLVNAPTSAHSQCEWNARFYMGTPSIWTAGYHLHKYSSHYVVSMVCLQICFCFATILCSRGFTRCHYLPCYIFLTLTDWRVIATLLKNRYILLPVFICFYANFQFPARQCILFCTFLLDGQFLFLHNICCHVKAYIIVVVTEKDYSWNSLSRKSYIFFF